MNLRTTNENVNYFSKREKCYLIGDKFVSDSILHYKIHRSSTLKKRKLYFDFAFISLLEMM